MTYYAAMQAAGHDGALQDESGELFIKATNQQEIDFYNAIALDEDLQRITFVYMGTLLEQQVSPDQQTQGILEQAVETGNIGQLQDLAIMANKNDSLEENQTCIVLENGLYGYKCPSVVDIKLGCQLWDDSASEDKRQRLDQVSNSTTSGTLGYRISGMNIYNPQTCERTEYDRWFGRSLTTDDVVEKGLKNMFSQPQQPVSSKQNDMRYVIVQSILGELEYIYKTIEVKEMRIISGSVLIIYEGDVDEFGDKLQRSIEWAEKEDKQQSGTSRVGQEEEEEEDKDEEDEENLRPPSVCTVKLIDFAHAKMTPGLGHDENVLKGLRNLIDGFRKLEK